MKSTTVGWSPHLFRTIHKGMPGAICSSSSPPESIGDPLSNSSFVRGLCIANGQYSSLCVSDVVLILGRFDFVEVDVQDREQVDSGEQVEARERERERKEEDKTRTHNARSNMWHHGWHVDGVNAHQWHLEPQCGVCTKWKCSRKTLV